MQVEVAVLDGGNAALCAAINAARAGCSVLLLESAPKPWRGGNSRHTRNFRCMHQAPIAPLTDRYLEDEYFDDLIKVTEGKTDEALARKAIRESEGCLAWMIDQGIRFQPSLSGTLTLAHANASAVTVDALGFTVADNGKGVGEAELNQIFERFYSGDSAQGGGHGLGLSIVREFANRMQAEARAWVAEGLHLSLRFKPATL